MKAPLDLGCFPTGLHYPGVAHLLRVAAIGVCEEVPVEHEVARLPLVAIDTETTGRDPSTDRIVEVAAVIWDGKAVSERFSWLVNPGCPIPAETTEVHGITDADVADKPPFSDILPELLAVLKGRVPLAYNAEFDKRFLMAEYARSAIKESHHVPAFRRNIEWVDPLVWVREVQKDEKSKSLGDVCERLQIPLTNAHRATDDAEAALRVLHAVLPDMRIPRTYAAFLQEQRRLSRQQDEERARWRRDRSA
jgi:DNA polymerase-3 subunit epsilon